MYEEFCCEEFAEYGNRNDYDNGAFIQEGRGNWDINGCCGGGCFVVQDIRFCPFCGANLWEIDNI